ncbi:alpha/beta hydrolase family esterase [Planobispora siamensis]|uniref:Polyhydroxybutyrate depolymerase n=1 Tax=Planobispora siamensis TaxID=936338 RepID=A0A8J3SMQ8_9ACTN|nr:PHB depolymerase family esterase [Planobispora siamensis]GIH97298.1 polyhydroxybutyrate depolymerase [Planobispora siamensis]
MAAATCVALSAAPPAPGGPVPPEPAPGRPGDVRAAACALTPTGGTVVRNVGGTGRPYRVRVPAGLSGQAPLLLSLHGGGQEPTAHENASGWNGFAAERKFIVAYPRGGSPLNAPSWLLSPASGDIAYLRDVVGDIARQWCVDPRRVHAAGFSNGGQMAGRLACDESDLIASAATHAGPLLTLRCAMRRPIGFGISVYEGDILRQLMQGHRDAWITNDRCARPPHQESGAGVIVGERYDCAGGTGIYWRLYGGGAHRWPTGQQGADLRERMWALFQAHPLP